MTTPGTSRTWGRTGTPTRTPSPPGPKTLLTLFDAEHGLGGIAGYDAAETTDEDPERVTAVGRLTAAWLRTAFHPDHAAWRAARETLTAAPDPVGRVESK
ncbi:hypothetical protein GCM10020254_08810 [Streptomyces goshikiensis]